MKETQLDTLHSVEFWLKVASKALAGIAMLAGAALAARKRLS